MNQQKKSMAWWIEMMARKGAEMENVGSMCHDCAFKRQEDINGYSEAVDAAANCLAYGGIFHCHTADYQDTGNVCIGFKYAKMYLDYLDTNVDAYLEEISSSKRPST